MQVFPLIVRLISEMAPLDAQAATSVTGRPTPVNVAHSGPAAAVARPAVAAPAQATASADSDLLAKALKIFNVTLVDGVTLIKLLSDSEAMKNLFTSFGITFATHDQLSSFLTKLATIIQGTVKLGDDGHFSLGVKLSSGKEVSAHNHLKKLSQHAYAAITPADGKLKMGGSPENPQTVTLPGRDTTEVASAAQEIVSPVQAFRVPTGSSFAVAASGLIATFLADSVRPLHSELRKDEAHGLLSLVTEAPVETEVV